MGFAVDDAGARAQADQSIHDQREATGEIIARTAVEPHARPVLPGDNPKCSHWPREGSLSVFVGRHGAMNPAGRVRCNM